jgi:hypothetical protein
MKRSRTHWRCSDIPESKQDFERLSSGNDSFRATPFVLLVRHALAPVCEYRFGQGGMHGDIRGGSRCVVRGLGLEEDAFLAA